MQSRADTDPQHFCCASSGVREESSPNLISSRSSAAGRPDQRASNPSSPGRSCPISAASGRAAEEAGGESVAPGLQARDPWKADRSICGSPFTVVCYCHDQVVAEFGSPQGLGWRAAEPVSWTGFRGRRGSVTGAERCQIAWRSQSIEKRGLAQTERRSTRTMSDDGQRPLAHLF
jgi:hypothetical protein